MKFSLHQLINLYIYTTDCMKQGKVIIVDVSSDTHFRPLPALSYTDTVSVNF